MHRDAGFTLTELLVSIAILALITGPIAGAIIVSLKTTDDAQSRLERSNDVDVATSVFASDIQSAAQVLAGPSSPGCGTATALLSLQWTDQTTTAPVAYAVSYGLVTTGSRTQLVRDFCVAGGAATRRVLAHNAASASAPLCDSTACTAAASSPRTVAVTITDTAAESFMLRGTRRIT